MTTQPALAVEDMTAERVLDGDSARKPARSRFAMERVNWPGTILLALCAVTVLIPLYVTVMMAFKTQSQAVDGNAFSWPAPWSIEGFVTAWELTNFPRAFTISLIVTVFTVVGKIILHSCRSMLVTCWCWLSRSITQSVS
jgi:raffinose/stachyose/melibiose transport system permease protein